MSTLKEALPPFLRLLQEEGFQEALLKSPPLLATGDADLTLYLRGYLRALEGGEEEQASLARGSAAFLLLQALAEVPLEEEEARRGREALSRYLP